MKAEQKPFIELVDKILAVTGSPDYLSDQKKQASVMDYEHQIDRMVFKLYGLTEDEIVVVEAATSDKWGN